jgi:uncharacterized protein (DUF934 family)
MAILKHGVPQRNDWLSLADDAALPEGTAVIVSLARWQAERNSLVQRNAPVGVRLKSDQSPVALAVDLDHVALVAIEFPKFTDGRGFSYARMLRDRFGYAGEIRAVGQVLRDQYLFMVRCGIDTVELPDDISIQGYVEALGEFSVWYQPASDDRIPVVAKRHQRPSVTGAAHGSTPLVNESVAAIWAY